MVRFDPYAHRPTTFMSDTVFANTKAGNAAVLSDWTRYTALQIARKHGCARTRVYTHAYERDRLATLRMRALRTDSSSYSLSLSPLFLFDCTLSFTSDASPGFFSNYINPYATPQDRIKNDSLGSTFVPIAQSFRERNDKRAKQVYPDNCSSPARCYCW